MREIVYKKIFFFSKISLKSFFLKIKVLAPKKSAPGVTTFYCEILPRVKIHLNLINKYRADTFGSCRRQKVITFMVRNKTNLLQNFQENKKPAFFSSFPSCKGN